MKKQWQKLKETIIEMRDNDGTITQQEVCKFLVNYMEVLEKQMQEVGDDAISRDAVNNLQKYRYNCGDTSIVCVSLASINALPSVTPICEERERGGCPWYTPG